MNNLEKYKEDILVRLHVGDSLTEAIGSVLNSVDTSIDNHSGVHLLNWMLAENKEPLLTDKAKVFIKLAVAGINDKGIDRLIKSYDEERDEFICLLKSDKETYHFVDHEHLLKNLVLYKVYYLKDLDI